MNRFRDLSIGSKLFAGFSVILLLFILIGTFTFFSTEQIQERSRTVEVRDFSGLNLSTGMEESLLKLEAYFAEAWASQDPLILEDIDIQQEKFTILLSEFKELARDEPAVIEQLDSLEKEFVEYYSLGKMVARFFIEGKREEALNLLSKFRRLAQDIRRKIDTAQNEDIARLSQSLGSIDTMARSTQRVNVALLIFTVILGTFMTISLTASIVGPVKSLVEGTQKISEGSFAYRVGYRARDEIGQLARSFNWMSERLQATTFSKSQLEQIVASRTDELRRARDELELRVDERTSQLQAAKDYAELLLKVVPSGIFTLDMSKKITSWNDQAEEITGYSAHEVIGKHCLSFMELPCSANCVFDTHDADISVIGQECQITTKSGQKRIISKNFDFLKDGSGAIIGSIESFEDITERQEAERKIREAAEEWRATFDSITDLISIHDKEYRIVRVNKAYADFFKVDPKDLIGIRCHKVFHNTDNPHPLCPHRMVLETMRSQSAQIYEPRLDLYFDVTTSPVFGNAGEVIGSVHVAKDITERRKAEEEIVKVNQDLRETNERLRAKSDELRKANEELEEMYKIKSEFTSMVSHELRTPLTAIKEGISLIFDESLGPTNEEQREFLGIAKRNVDRLTRLINDVLDFSKLTSKKVELKEELCEVNELITAALDSYRPVIEKKKLGLSVDLNVTEGLLLRLDADRISQVLINLIDNAVKFTDQGSLKVFTRRDDAHNLLTVYVEDTGIGIKEADIPKLFKSFSQLGGKHGRKAGGTGLGLAICREIAEQSGGKIWVESEYGKGSIFCFALPLRERRRKS